MAYLIDGTTPIPSNGDTGWGTVLNAAINAIDGRFTYQSSSSIPATKALASGIVGTTLAATVVTSSLTSVGTLTSLGVSGNVTIGGDLTVNGTTTTISTTELLIEDNLITLNSTVTGSPSTNAGVEVERGTSDNVAIRWNETSDKWEFTNDGSTYKTINAAIDLTGTALPTGLVTSSLTSVGTIATGVWQGTAIGGQYGGTGVSNAGKTITLGGNISTSGDLTTSGAYSLTLTVSGATSVTLPTTGTLATLAGSESLTNKKLGSLTSNGIVTTSGSDGTLSVTATTGSGEVVLTTGASITDAFLTTPEISGSLSSTNSTFTLLTGVATSISVGSATCTTQFAGSVSVSNALTVTGTTILGPASIVQQSGTTYTIDSTDQGKIIEMTNSSDAVITVPNDSTETIPVGAQVVVIRANTGKVQFAADSGLTLYSDSSKQFISTQYSAVTLIKKASNTWYLIGNLSAS